MGSVFLYFTLVVDVCFLRFRVKIGIFVHCLPEAEL